MYNGAEMPALPRRKMGFSGNCTAEARDGKLFIADRGTEGGNYAFFRYPCFVNPSEETILEIQLKPVSGWSSVLIENGVSGEEIQFYPDWVKARRCGLSYSMDATDAFHTYRVLIKDRDFKIYVDGKLGIDGAGKLTRSAYNGRSGIALGAAKSPNLGEAYWESVNIYSKARSLNDLVLSIRFEDLGDFHASAAAVCLCRKETDSPRHRSKSDTKKCHLIEDELHSCVQTTRRSHLPPCLYFLEV